MSIDMSQFYQVFFEETEEHLAAMESLLLGLDIAQPDPEDLNAIFRAAHSIKGSSGTFGFTDLTSVTHTLETLLDRLRKNEIALQPAMVDAFLEAGDVLKAMLAGHRSGDAQQGADPQAVVDICARLNELAADTPKSAPAAATAVSAITSQTVHAAASAAPPARATAPQTWNIEFVPTAQAAADDLVLANLLEQLRELGELKILSQPPASSREVGYWHLHLMTGSSAADIGELIDFVAEREAWLVGALPPPLDDADGAFGLFDDAAGLTQVDDRFGLFEDFPDDGPDRTVTVEDDASYGFFEPLPVSDTPEEPAEPALSVAPATVLLEDGDGFGFFEPLPEAAPPALETAVPSPLQAVVAPVVPENVVPAAPTPGSGISPSSSPAPREAPARHGPAAGSENASIRVGVEKVDQLINLVGELVITQAMLLQCAEQMQDNVPERLLQGLGQLERNTRDLQESVMSIRMLPISFVFSRFPRVVRDLSAKLGKQVELKMAGETTELDKGLIERIADPLTHLIRNSLDHGVEMPETRVAAGKSPVGTITLRAAHQGGNIVIEVGDDGAGLNRQKILAKARERGFQVSDQMTDQEVWALIFEAGFSTADQVTDVSGRGVGMDVVRKNIQAMGGRVEIESMTGVGTRMTVRLPLTLAILDGMSVAVGQQIYILPLSYVVESLQPEEQDVKTLSNQARVVRVRGEYLPVIALHELFNIPGAQSRFSQGILVVLDADGTKAALFVDALVGQHQVVIKSLENNYRRVVGVSGATIMGDGHVALILDVSMLANMARSAQMAAA